MPLQGARTTSLSADTSKGMQHLPSCSSSSMGTGGVSAFAAIHGEVSAPKFTPASSTSTTKSIEISCPPDRNSSLALSDDPGNLPVVPRSVVELGSESVSVLLEKGENVVVVGLYSLWVKRGEVWLLGARLRASSTLHHVFVPVTHAVPSITAASDLAELVISTNASGIRYMGDISQHFAGIWEPTLTETTLSFHVLGYHSQSVEDLSKVLRRLALEDWLPPILSLLRCERPTISRILVSGAKETGKSTLCRILINSMLTMTTNWTTGTTKAFPDGVIFLDIDPGQPEFAAPGVVYLAHVRAPVFGPSFTNLIVPGATENVMLRMHYLGANTPREVPSNYQKCVSNLMSLYRRYDNIPLVINTCGCTTGSGKAMLLSAIGDLALTDIIHIGDTRNTATHHLMQTDIGCEPIILTQILPQSNGTPLKSSRDLREMQLQSYLHTLGSVNGSTVWDRLPLATLRDILPAASDAANDISMIVMLGDALAPEHLVDALKGSVAAIVVIKHDSSLYGLLDGFSLTGNSVLAGTHIAQTPDGQLPYLVCGDQSTNPLEPESTECIGQGIVLAADSEQRQFEIKSPVSAAHLSAEIAKGHKIALMIARQQGQWSTTESILAREQRSDRSESNRGERMVTRERAYAASLSADSDGEVDAGWQNFFEELRRS